jgi:hypothetical protein
MRRENRVQARSRFEPVLMTVQLPQEPTYRRDRRPVAQLLRCVQCRRVDFPNLQEELSGILVRQNGGEIFDDRHQFGNTETVEWVMPVTAYNCQKEDFISYENQPSLSWTYVSSEWQYPQLATPEIAWVENTGRVTQSD